MSIGFLPSLLVMRIGTLMSVAAEDADNKAEAARLFREALRIFENLGSPNADVARRSSERVESKSS